MICALLAAAAVQQDSAAEVFLFPRQVSSQAIRGGGGVKSGPLPQGSAQGKDIFSPFDGLFSDKGLPGVEASPGQRDLRALVKRAAIGGREEVIVKPTMELDHRRKGYFLTSREFSIEGAILGPKSTWLSSSRGSGIFQIVSGYWEEFNIGRVFFGCGVRVRFRLDSYKPLFGRNRCRAYTPVQLTGEKKAPILRIEIFGVRPDREIEFVSEDPLVKIRRSTEGIFIDFEQLSHKENGVVLKSVIRLATEIYEYLFRDQEDFVEPILFSIEPDSAKVYVANHIK